MGDGGWGMGDRGWGMGDGERQRLKQSIVPGCLRDARGGVWWNEPWPIDHGLGGEGGGVPSWGWVELTCMPVLAWMLRRLALPCIVLCCS
jgi:hypothetical protein